MWLDVFGPSRRRRVSRAGNSVARSKRKDGRVRMGHSCRGTPWRAATTHLQSLRSHLSFALASAVVCHCMFDGSSAPPQASGTM